jgi:hypothetical protein
MTRPTVAHTSQNAQNVKNLFTFSTGNGLLYDFGPIRELQPEK